MGLISHENPKIVAALGHLSRLRGRSIAPGDAEHRPVRSGGGCLRNIDISLRGSSPTPTLPRKRPQAGEGAQRVILHDLTRTTV